MSAKKIMILGVTASGKGRLAFDLAQEMGSEIVSIDSMKVYRRMDIGTAKPPPKAQKSIKYHLVDIVEPSESFSVGRFTALALEAAEQILGRNKPVVAVGGTALYVKALLHGLFDGPGSDPQIRTRLKQECGGEGSGRLHTRLKTVDPQSAERIHPNDSKRIIRALEVYELTGRPISSLQNQWTPQVPTDSQKAKDTNYQSPITRMLDGITNHNWFIIGLRRDKDEDGRRINLRVKKMIEEGLVDEVRSLLVEERPLSMQAACAIGYAEIIKYLRGGIKMEDAVELIKKNTRLLAKHQRTWFKRFTEVNWLDIATDETSQQVFERAKILVSRMSGQKDDL